MVVSLVLMLALGVQSCVATVGGTLATGLGDPRGDNLTSAGALGMLAAFLWLVGAALVLGKPRASMWLFLSAIPVCVVGGALGLDDLYVWGGVSGLFALGSWKGIEEQERELAERTAQAEMAALPAGGWHPDPFGERRLRYHDGGDWTPHTSD